MSVLGNFYVKHWDTKMTFMVCGEIRKFGADGIFYWSSPIPIEAANRDEAHDIFIDRCINHKYETRGVKSEISV